MPLWIGFGIVVMAVPLLLLFQRRYELGDWIKETMDRTARWRERVRPWLLQHPRIVYLLGIAWLLYAFFAVMMLAKALLFHQWFWMVVWGLSVLQMVVPLLRQPFHPARVEQEQPESPGPHLPLTAADQEAVNEIYQQRRKQRS